MMEAKEIKAISDVKSAAIKKREDAKRKRNTLRICRKANKAIEKASQKGEYSAYISYSGRINWQYIKETYEAFGYTVLIDPFFSYFTISWRDI